MPIPIEELQKMMERQQAAARINAHTDKHGAIRTFATGATRSPLGEKLQFEGYLNPLVLKRFAEYMRKHQTDSAGNQRAADNWQKNIDMASLCDSKTRHDMDVWLHSRGYDAEAAEPLEEALCACLFNTMALLKQVLEQSGRGRIKMASTESTVAIP